MVCTRPLTGIDFVAGAKPQRLVALYASHIANAHRLDYLRDMVESWRGQVHPVPLFMSISAISKYRQRVLDLVGAVPMLHVTVQPEHLTQGQHYKFLAHLVSGQYDSQNTWTLFTDDDDIWHSQRSMYYQQVGPTADCSLYARYSATKMFYGDQTLHSLLDFWGHAGS